MSFLSKITNTIPTTKIRDIIRSETCASASEPISETLFLSTKMVINAVNPKIIFSAT